MTSAFRLAYRSIWLAGELGYAAVTLFLNAAIQGFRPSLHSRTLWLQRHSRRVLRVFANRVETSGMHPEAGLLVSNHLSYLDILLLGSEAPAVFVSKAEVKNWPVLGWFGRLCGTIFVERARRTNVGRVAEEIAAHLREGHLVVLFPEGTSSDGREVLPFKSSLLEPARGAHHRLFAAHLSYDLPGGHAETDVCYWGDMTFLPHALKLLGKAFVTARARFSEPTNLPKDRKELARRLQAEVAQLKESGLNKPELGASAKMVLKAD